VGMSVPMGRNDGAIFWNVDQNGVEPLERAIELHLHHERRSFCIFEGLMDVRFMVHTKIERILRTLENGKEMHIFGRAQRVVRTEKIRM